MTQLAFGSGAFWGINSISNPTPVRFGVTQSCSLDFSASAKPIFGSNQLPVSVARGAMTVSGKVTMAQLNGRLINELFFGSSMASGQTLAIDSESGTIPGSSAYTVTVANSGTWAFDLGVVYAATGIPFTRVASSPSAGQYSVASGVYTFAAADANAGVKISYTYTTTGGNTITISNQPMGAASTFKSVLSLPYNGQKATFTLNACISTKMSFQTALEDFTKPQFDFDAFADSAGILGTISVAELS